ncbi:hypothetical protein JMUB6875_43110 [Nocardia sp. JMUB6875]
MAENGIPLTSYQRDIWTETAMFPGVASYNVANSVQIRGAVDLPKLNDCLRDLFARHEAFRLRFGSDRGIPYQWAGAGVPEIEFLDMSGESDPRSACLTWMAGAAGQPIDYTRESGVIRICLLREHDESHYLFGGGHHLVFDGISLGVAMTQLLVDYHSRTATGQPADFPGSSYGEFASAAAEYAGSDPWSEDLEFFANRLAGCRPAVFDRASLAPSAFRIERHTFEVGRELVTGVRSRPTSLYAHFLASVAILLGRMHRTDDIVVGIPFGNRHSDSEWSTIGTFANVLPLRIRLDEDSTLADLTRRIQDEIDATKKHERISLGELCNGLAQSSSAAVQPFDVAVSKVRLPQLSSLSEQLGEFRSYPMGYSSNALQIFVKEFDQDEIVVDLDYCTDVFDADQPIEMVARRLLHLMRTIVDQPGLELRRVDLMLPTEKSSIARWNSTSHPYDRTLTLDRAFTRQAARTPDAVAVCGAQTLTYAELDAKSDALAAELRSHGVGHGDRIAVMMQRRPELMVAIFATLKCGAAYVPIDPSYPRKRVEYLLSDCAATAVLACGDLPLVAERPELAWVLVDGALPEPEHLPSAARGDDLAYVIYTSGSTGNPKGVMVEHHSVINRLAWMQRAYPLDHRDVVLQKTPISFDVSVWELFWWAMTGARLALLEPGAEKDPAELLDAIASHGVTVMHFVPSMLDAFLDLLEREPARIAQTATLRTVFSSGEALRRGLVDRFNRVFGGAGRRDVRLVNLYGPTEATVDVSCYETPSDPAVPTVRVPIGRPIDNIELHVLGSGDLELPVGIPGELVISGVGLARGYLDRPELTAEKFRKSPFRENERIYHTGDLVRRLADGSLEYLGRIDSQVKIRGNRVELGEVEDALESFGAVRGAATTVVDDPVRGQILVAYYVADTDLDPRDLRAHVAARLPQFMVPARFLRIERIPLSPSGKTDRSALPAIADRASVEPPGDRVLTAAEQVLAEVFGHVLAVPRVGIDDDFFVLGGDSLLVLRVCALARDRGLDFSPRDVLTHPTIAQLAQVAQDGDRVVEESVAPFALLTEADSARLGFAEDAYPLAQLQWGMLYHSIESESSTLYHDVFRYTLRMPWNEQAWLRAAARLVQRHPALRTSFSVTDFSEPLQIVHHSVPLAFTTTDLGSVPDAAAAAHIDEYIEQRRRHAYRMDAAPLYAARVFRLPDTVEFVFSFHHAILDGWSVAMMMSQLLSDYLAEIGHPIEGDSAVEIPPKYADFVRAERQALASEQQRRFWTEELRDGAATSIGEAAAAAGEEVERALHVFPVPPTVTGQVRELAEAERVPLRTVLFAAHCLTLRLLSGTTDITTGVVTHNRPARLGSEQTAGLFLNTLPVRMDLSGPDRSLRELVRAVRAQELRLDPHRAYPLSAIQRGRGGVSPIATAFNFVNFHIAEPLLGNPQVEVVDVRVAEETNLQVMVNVVTNPGDKSLTLRLDCDGVHVTDDVAASYTRIYAGVLAALGARPDSTAEITRITSSPAILNAEQVLVRVFAEMLGAASVGIDDDFFALGGDSLLVLKVCALAGRRGLRITPRDILAHPTARQLAQVARAGSGSEESVAPFALVAEIDRARLGFAEDAYPLAQLQWGMLYHSIESESSTLYHDVFRYTLRMPWNEQAWLRAAAELVARHPALRTSFHINEFSQPLQVVHREVPLPFAVTDLTEMPADAGSARVADHIQQWRSHSYRLDEAPLFDVHAFRLPNSVEVVFAFHHAILDGWSVAMLMSQLLQNYLYESGHIAEPVDTGYGDLPTYAEFIRAEQQALAAPEMRRFWQETLRDTEPTTIGATGLSDNRTGGVDRVAHTVAIPPAVADAVRILATRERVPVKTILFAAYCSTLQLFSGSPRVTTGVVTHNRQARFGVDQVAGLFLNTIPVPVDLPGPEHTWREVIATVRARELELDPYRAYPLSAIHHDHGDSEVVVTAFNFVNVHVAAGISAQRQVEVLDFQVEEQTNFSLLLNAIENPLTNALNIRIDADGLQVDAALAQAFGRAYLTILNTLATRPDQPVDFTAVTPSTPLTGPRAGATPHVVDAFAAHVAQQPDAPAVVHGEHRMSYQQLWQRAERIAAELLDRGIRPGMCVGVAAPQTPGRIAAVVGIALAGAAVLPLDAATQPAARLRSIIDDAAPLLVLVGDEAAPTIPAELAVRISDLPATPDRRPTPDFPRTLEQTAYVLFTSGSTGRPKGVEMPHRALANLVAWQLSAASGRIGERCPHTLQLAPLTFDVAFQEIFSTLCGGGTLHLADDDLRTDARSLLRLLDSSRIERVFLPYVALQQLALVAAETGRYPRALSRVVSSGEQLRITPQIRAFLAGLAEPLLENQYGPTETHVATYHTLSGDPGSFPVHPPIGTPIAGAELHILDSRRNPVPAGALGEIYLGGTCLADGYLGRPDLTQQRYVAAPHGMPGTRLYRTGDLGRRHPDGYVVYEGRLDTQVKIRGFRVEAAEVELAVLAADPAVREVAVVARSGFGDVPVSSADTVLAAYLVGDRAAVDIADIRRRVTAALPAHAVPAHFEWLDSIPRTASGKRADAALRRLPLQRRASARPAAPPRDELERELLDLVAEIIGTNAIGIDDSFFDLGGTSISATRLILAMENRYHLEVPMSAFVAAPTVATLARLLRDRGRATAFEPDPLVPIKPTGDKPPLFLVHPLGGTVSCYVPLSRYLPLDQPLYALQAAGIDAGTTPLQSIPDMAAHYVRAIRRVQPEGPYHIGGWSLGGFIAFEMLRQLEAQGQEIPTFVLLDSMMGRAESSSDAMAMATHRLFMWELLHGDRAETAAIAEIPADLRTEDEVLQYILDRAVAEGVLPEGSPLGLIRRLFAVFEATWRAAVEYEPQITRHDLTLLHAAEPLPEILTPTHDAVGSLHRDATNGWDAMTTGEVDVIEVPGNHLTMMDEPRVEALSQILAKIVANNAPQKG